MGALNTPAIAALLENTPAVRDLDLDEFDALLICGGQGPMWQDFRNRGDPRRHCCTSIWRIM